MEKIIRKNAFELKNKNMHRVKFNPGLALIALRTTEPWFSFSFSAPKRKNQWPSENVQEINKPFVGSHSRGIKSPGWRAREALIQNK